MTVTTTPHQLTVASRLLLILGSVGAFIVAATLDDPGSHLWLDNGQPVAFVVSGILSLMLAVQPWHRRLSIVAGSSSLGTVSWRLGTAILEAVRDGGPGDLLRVGTYLLLMSFGWIGWTSVWLIVGITEKVRSASSDGD